MHDDQLAAEQQLTHSIFGNWRSGITALGGATCVGGKVTFFIYTLTWHRMTQRKINTYNLNEETQVEEFIFTLITWIKSVVLANLKSKSHIWPPEGH